MIIKKASITNYTEDKGSVSQAIVCFYKSAF